MNLFKKKPAPAPLPRPRIIDVPGISVAETEPTPPQRPRILIAIPHLRDFPGWYVLSLMGLIREANTGMALAEGKPVDIARQALAEAAVEGDSGGPYTHVLFLDSDMRFPPTLIARLLRMNVDIASGLYFGRTADMRVPHVYRFYGVRDDGGRAYKPLGNEVQEYEKTVPVDAPETWAGPEPRIITADAVGFGCVLIRTDVFRNMPKPWFRSDETGGAEDFYFCERAIASGYKVHVDLSLECEHELKNVFAGRLMFMDEWLVGTDQEWDWNSDDELIVHVGPHGERRRVHGGIIPSGSGSGSGSGEAEPEPLSKLDRDGNNTFDPVDTSATEALWPPVLSGDASDMRDLSRA